MDVVIVDYGSGNLRSAQRALERVGAQVTVTNDMARAARADAVVIPGVGAFSACMSGIRACGAETMLRQRVRDHAPILGICVGLQVLFTEGVEGGSHTPGIDVLPGVVEPLEAPVLPHMGWDTVTVPDASIIFRGIADERFSFVHSFAIRAWADVPGIVSTTTYGDTFVAAVEHGSITATQFHPEKSGAAGLLLLENWLHSLQ